MTPSSKRILIFIFGTILHAYAFSQGDDDASSLYRLGKSAIGKNPAKAFLLLEKSMIISRDNQDWKHYVQSLNELASFNLERDETREVVFDWLKQSFKNIKLHPQDDQLALLHFNTAEYYNRITMEVDAPISHYLQAKKIWTKSKGEWSAEVSHCYHGLGNIYKYYKYDFYEAEKCYERSLLIREKVGFGDSLVMYRNYYSLAATNRSQHDFEKAISYGEKTLEVAKKLEPKRLELANGMVANIYRDMGESARAKKYYLNALALNAKTENLESRAWYYLCLGETFLNDTLLPEALQYFHQAYELYSRPEVKDEELFVRLQIVMMDSYSLNHDLYNFSKKRRDIFRELEFLKKIPYSREAAELWLLVGTHHDRNKNYDSALFFYQKALTATVPTFSAQYILKNPSETQIGFRYYVNEILAKKASGLRMKFSATKKSEYLEHAVSSLQLAERLLSAQRNTLDMEAAKWKFLDANYDLYEDILASLYQGRTALKSDSLNNIAFQYFEKSKARSLADALTQSELSNQIGGQDSLLRMHTDLKRQLFTEQDLLERETEGAKDLSNIRDTREKIIKLDQQIQIYKLAIEEKYPGYFNVKYGYHTVPVAQVQKVLKEKKQVLLEYFWGSHSVYGIGMDDKQIIFQRLGSPDSLKKIIDGIMGHFEEDGSSTSPQVFTSFVNNAHQLYKFLLDPFSSMLSNHQRIQIIPDGPISQVPFEVLLEENDETKQVNYRALKFLLKSFSIGYAYSSAMLIHKVALRRKPTPSLLAIGFTGSQPLRSDIRLAEIGGAEEELNALGARFNDGKFLIDKEATESNFKMLAPDFDIIHLAIHGRGDTKKDFAASLFFRSKMDKDNDGELHAYELYGIKLKAVMAVLSACESGLGKGYKGEGMISMASAFTYSGCENILMSLWKVNDQASIGLMDNFYGFLSEGDAIDDALRKTKLAYLETADELTADPKIWGPLVVYGSLDEVFQKDRNRIFVIAVAMVGVSVILFLFRRKFSRSSTY